MMRKWLALPVVAALGLGACGGGSGGDGPTEGADGATSIKVQLTGVTITYLDGFGAIDTGAFERQGLDVELMAPTNSSPQTGLQLANGDADFVEVSTGGVLAPLASGRDVRIIAAAATPSTSQVVLRNDVVERIEDETGVTPDSPVEDRVRALEGLTLDANSPGGPLERAMRSVLEANGLDPDNDVHLQLSSNPTAGAILAAFSSGETDGFAYSPPGSIQPIIDGTGQIWLSGPDGDLGANDGYYVVWGTSTEMVRDHPDVVDKVIAALNETNDLLQSDPDQVMNAIRDRYPDFDDTLYERSFRSVLPAYQGTALDEDRLAQSVEFFNSYSDTDVPDDQDVSDPQFYGGDE